ncbi:MAG: hypothetical protein AAAFM81_01635 [Pseudomonadota bacterium]
MQNRLDQFDYRIVVTACCLLTSCSSSYDAEELCDARYLEPESSEWLKLDEPPADFDRTKFAERLESAENVLSDGEDADESIDYSKDGTIIWYVSGQGDRHGCFVKKGSHFVNATIELSGSINDPSVFSISLHGHE